MFIERDREAAELLTAPMTLPVALRRADQWYWQRRIASRKDTGTFKFPRVWTHRDERLANALKGRGDWPHGRRTDRVTHFLQRHHDDIYRSVICELTDNGKIATLGPRLEAAKAAFFVLCEQARLAADCDPFSKGAYARFQDARQELQTLFMGWLDWIEPAPNKRDRDLGFTWGEVRDQERDQLAIIAEDYAFHNAVIGAANCWCELLTHDESEAVYFIRQAAKFFAYYSLSAKLWKEQERSKFKPREAVTIGHQTAQSVGVAAMNALSDFRRLLLEGPETDLQIRDATPFSEATVKAYRDSLIRHCKENGVGCSAAEGLAFASKVEALLMPTPKQGEQSKVEPYPHPEDLAEDEWIYNHIHNYSFADLKVEHNDWCQAKKKTQKFSRRNTYKNRADRYADYHGLSHRRFKDYCQCPQCRVSMTPD